MLSGRALAIPSALGSEVATGFARARHSQAARGKRYFSWLALSHSPLLDTHASDYRPVFPVTRQVGHAASCFQTSPQQATHGHPDLSEREARYAGAGKARCGQFGQGVLAR